MSFSFHSLIPILKDESGHDFPYHKRVEEAVDGLGGHFQAYVNARCNASFLPARWKRWFRRKRDPKWNAHYQARLMIDFSKIFRSQEGAQKKRIFFLESFSTADLLAFTLASTLFSKKEDGIWLLFRPIESKKMMAVRNFLIRAIAKISSASLTLFTDCDLFAPILEKGCKERVFILDHYPSLISQREPPSNELISLAWLGGPRVEKGLETIRYLMTLDDPISSKFSLTLSERAFLPTLPPHLRLLRLHKDLSWSEYEKAFHQAEVLLLPYDPIRYKNKASGIFIEAVLTGKIPLVKEGSSLAHRLREFDLDELIVQWEEDPLFFTHLYELLQSSSMREKLRKMQDHYREHHSLSSLKKTFQYHLEKCEGASLR